jgi:hypothetical protein
VNVVNDIRQARSVRSPGDARLRDMVRLNHPTETIELDLNVDTEALDPSLTL